MRALKVRIRVGMKSSWHTRVHLRSEDQRVVPWGSKGIRAFTRVRLVRIIPLIKWWASPKQSRRIYTLVSLNQVREPEYEFCIEIIWPLTLSLCFEHSNILASFLLPLRRRLYPLASQSYLAVQSGEQEKKRVFKVNHKSYHSYENFEALLCARYRPREDYDSCTKSFPWQCNF